MFQKVEWIKAILVKGMVTDMQYEQVKELIELFEKTDLNDMEVRLGDAAIRLNRSPVQQPQFPTMFPGVMPPAPQNMDAVMAPQKTETNESMTPAPVSSAGTAKPADAAAPAETQAGGKRIKAPIVGTFYQSSAPDQPPFLKVGDTVSAGDVVCIIEAMKFMNEVTSDVSGTVTDILVEDGQFVEFGQELFCIQ